MIQSNQDPKTVEGFGEEWALFKQDRLSNEEFDLLCQRYFQIFPWHLLPPEPQGFDMGSGSGRFALHVSPRVGRLYCIDASKKALDVAQSRFNQNSNCQFIHASVDEVPLPSASLDFGYSLGVLHHVPDTQDGINKCARLLKPGAPFLIYLYYSLDNRPVWYRALWKTSEVLRKLISSFPFAIRRRVTDLIALLVYYPLAKMTKLLDLMGVDASPLPLSSYKDCSFYTMRTDALDRFGTALEQRFSRKQIEKMLTEAGFANIVFSEHVPYWVAVGIKR